jgi:hypothetical protein
MRGVTIELPSSASEKLTELQIQRDNALDLSRAAQARINMLDGESGGHLLEKLTAERDLWASRHHDLHRLLSAIQQWLFNLRGVTLQPVRPPAVTLAKGETPADALAKVRAAIAATSQELAQVRRAPLPAAELVKAAEEYVARRGAVSGPRVSVVRDYLQVQWQDDVIADKQSLLAVLCWLAPQSVLAALKREIEAQPSAANAMPAAERVKKVAELEAKLLDAERKESALLDGVGDVLPRPEMNPLAFLQVAIVPTEAAAAAA